MQPMKKELGHLILENFLEYLVFCISRSQTIPMTNQEYLIVDHNLFRVIDNLYVKILLEIPEHPHVMIPGKDGNWNTGIPDLHHLTKQPRISFGNGVSVFEPHVEQVAQEKNVMGILRNGR
jgi:hypothetical protein